MLGRKGVVVFTCVAKTMSRESSTDLPSGEATGWVLASCTSEAYNATTDLDLFIATINDCDAYRGLSTISTTAIEVRYRDWNVSS